jgi:hypothetical protein
MVQPLDVMDIPEEEKEAKRKSGTYNHDFSISEHVAHLEKSYKQVQRESASVQTSLIAQRKQNEKLKSEIKKMEKSLIEALDFIKKVKTWK